jgi:hypothetical protein
MSGYLGGKSNQRIRYFTKMQ